MKWTPVHETAAEYMDRIGWCDCKPSQDHCAVCRAKRAKEREAQQPAVKVFTGTPRPSKKLDWDV